MTRLETLAALKKYEDGADLSPAEQELMDRAIEVNDWLETRCLAAVKSRLVEVIAEVLTRIPQSALESLVEKDTYLVFPAIHAAWVEPIRVQPDGTLSLVILASFLEKCPKSVAVGFVAHELAHVFLGHTSGGDSDKNPNELAADGLARSWGFTQEIGIVNALHPRSH